MKISTPRISVIIPAYNEEASIGKMLDEMPWKLFSEVIVVANACTDATAQAAKAQRARVVEEPRMGYGQAVQTGIAAANSPDIFIFMDGDASDFPQEIPLVLQPILEDTADFVVGSRTLGTAEKGSLLLQSRMGNALATHVIKWRYGVTYTDLAPFKAICAKDLAALNMTDTTYGWNIEMQIKAAREGLRIKEVPVSYRKRIGQSKVSGTLKGTLLASCKILYTLGKYSRRNHETRSRSTKNDLHITEK